MWEMTWNKWQNSILTNILKWNGECTDTRLKEKNTRGKDSMKFGFGQIGDVGQ